MPDTALSAEARLRQSEVRYRELFGAIDEGFCIIEVLFDEAGAACDYRFLEVNAAFELQTGLTAVVGRTMRELVPDHEPLWFETYGRIVRTGLPERFEDRADALDRWFDVHASPVGPPEAHQLAILFHDIRARKRAELALREVQQRQGFLLDFSDAIRAEAKPDALADLALRMLAEELDLDRCYVVRFDFAGDRADFLYQYCRDGLAALPAAVPLTDFPDSVKQVFDRTLIAHDAETDPALSPLDRQSLAAIGQRAFVAASLRSGRGNPVAAIVAVSSTPRDWTPGEISLIENAAERTWNAIERARAEDTLRDSERRLRVLVAELQHRVRNMLTVVRSVFSRSVEAGGDADTVADHFKGRLDAMARTQVILTQQANPTANLENLIRDELLSVGVREGNQVTIAGPEVALRRKDAEALGMAIHELTTNAVKYGALSVPGAKLDIRWHLDAGYRDPGTLELIWLEQDVPGMDTNPARRGFGRELIEEALPYRLGADTKLEFRSGGVCCSISVPLTAEDDDAPGRMGAGAA